MNGIIGEFRIGEDVSVALEATAGDPATVTAIAAKMKPAKVSGNRIVLDDTAPGIDMAVISQGAAGWLVSLGNIATASLTPGLYSIDARLTFASAVEITDQTGFIALTRAAVA